MINLKARIGIFFSIVGVALLFLFSASLSTDKPMWQLLIGGLPAAALGFSLWWRSRERPSVERFRLVRRILASLFSKKANGE